MVVVVALVMSVPFGATAADSGRTIVIRVKAATPSTLVRFSGWYQSDEADLPIKVTNQAPTFGIKLKTNSLRAEFRKESGAADLLIEAVEFVDDREIGSVSCTGNALGLDVYSDGAGTKMSTRRLD